MQPSEAGHCVLPAGESKLANVLFARELARREAGGSIKAYSLHPGAQRRPAYTVAAVGEGPAS